MPKQKGICTKKLEKLSKHNKNIHLESCEQCRNKSKTRSITSFLTKTKRVGNSQLNGGGVEEVQSTSSSVEEMQSTSSSVEEVQSTCSSVESDVRVCSEDVDIDFHTGVEVSKQKQEPYLQDVSVSDSKVVSNLITELIEVVAGDDLSGDNVDDVSMNPGLGEDEEVLVMDKEAQELSEPVYFSTGFEKCEGFRFMVHNPAEIYSTFPFTLLPGQNFQFENSSLHHVDCVKKKYIVYQASDDNPLCNKVCFDLRFSKSLESILSLMSNSELYKSQTTNKYLSHHQMELRLNNCKTQLAKRRLQVHTQSKTIARLDKTLELHQRFLHSLQEHKIHRLHDLVDVALRQKRSIGYILQKVTDAIDGIYNPHYKEDDKELAFIILQFGGPALLDIVHRAIKLPSTSTAYKMIKGSRTINTSVNADVSELTDNFKIDSEAPKYGHMLKIDEHYVDKRARWCPQDNKIYGVCYDHCRDVDLSFDTYEDVVRLRKDVDEGAIHLPKECMVIATASNSGKINTQPVVIWPTCIKMKCKFR